MPVPESFTATVTTDDRGRVVVPVPFDPDAVWGTKPRHHVTGTVGGHKVRGPLDEVDGGYRLTLGAAWLRDCHVVVGSEIAVTLAAEGPQRIDLPADIADALDGDPEAAASFDALATFYRKGYLRWIDGTKRRPDVRAARIAEMIDLLKAGKKERPRG